MYDRENVNPREIGGAKRSVSRSVHEFLRSNVSRSSTDRIFIARRVLRSSGFDGRPTMSRGRPRWGATFSIRKVERRDDENSEETGADPESTDPVCPSVVDFATRFPRSVLPFFRSFVLSFFRSSVRGKRGAQQRKITASRLYFLAFILPSPVIATKRQTKKRERERERNNRDVAITATIVVLALGTRTEPAIRRFYPRSLSACKNHAKRIKRQSVGR